MNRAFAVGIASVIAGVFTLGTLVGCEPENDAMEGPVPHPERDPIPEFEPQQAPPIEGEAPPASPAPSANEAPQTGDGMTNEPADDQADESRTRPEPDFELPSY